MSESVTVAQETVTLSLLASLLACLAASIALAEYLALQSIESYVVLLVATCVTSTYVVPNLTALWLGRPLAEIMSD